MADALDGRRLCARPLTGPERRRVGATLNDLVTVSNPLDYHTFIWGDAQRLTATFTAMLRCGFDFTVLVIDPPRGDRCADGDWRIAIDAFAAALGRTGAHGGVLATLPESLPEAWSERLMARGIASLAGVEEGLAAIEAAADMGESWAARARTCGRSAWPGGRRQPRPTNQGPCRGCKSRQPMVTHGARRRSMPANQGRRQIRSPPFEGPRPLAEGREIVLTEWEAKQRLARAGPSRRRPARWSVPRRTRRARPSGWAHRWWSRQQAGASLTSPSGARCASASKRRPTFRPPPMPCSPSAKGCSSSAWWTTGSRR